MRARPAASSDSTSWCGGRGEARESTYGAAGSGIHVAAGADQVIFADKVMCLRNDHDGRRKVPATWEEVPGDVANGEIGMIVNKAGKQGQAADGTHASSSRRSRVAQYTFWESELNGDSEGGRANGSELAYAVTVHKSQGSQFKVDIRGRPRPVRAAVAGASLHGAHAAAGQRDRASSRARHRRLREFASPSRSETARRLTCLFRPADPFALGDGTVVDGAHVHRTGARRRSRSLEVRGDRRRRAARPRTPLPATRRSSAFPGEHPRHPDFTIQQPGQAPVYWEHLGMLDLAGYRADWEARKAWYASHDILPWDERRWPGRDARLVRRERDRFGDQLSRDQGARARGLRAAVARRSVLADVERPVGTLDRVARRATGEEHEPISRRATCRQTASEVGAPSAGNSNGAPLCELPRPSIRCCSARS